MTTPRWLFRLVAATALVLGIGGAATALWAGATISSLRAESAATEAATTGVVDVGFALVNGKRVLGGSGDAPGHGWMELLGSGMVNRRVIEFAGLDPDQWQGFAFGVGVDRLAMLKYGMDDLRAFFDGDQRWLAHYGFAALDVPTLSGGVGARA